MNKTYVIYESKYGCTKDIANKLALILGPAKYLKPEEWNKDYVSQCNMVVIGSPIYYEKINKNILEFVDNNIEWLKSKKVILFCVALSKKGAEKYLEPLKHKLGNSVISQLALGGKIQLDKLVQEDYLAMRRFSKLAHIPFKDINNVDIKEIVRYGNEIKRERDYIEKIPKYQLKKYAKELLSNHKSCTLCTSYNQCVRATPVDYTYKAGNIYILSEGGQKFANLLTNNNVSIAIYNDFQGMNTVEGMQITGEAQIIEDQSKEYEMYLNERGIKKEKLPSPLHLIKVRIICIEMLWYKFKNKGYNIKQYLDWDSL